MDQKLQTRDQEVLLGLRTSFKNREKLSQDEDQLYEYKEYSWPISEGLQDNIKQVICSFLNTKGGYLFMGISDSKFVSGIQLDSQQRDEFKRLIQEYSLVFSPRIDMVHDPQINVAFLPIKDTFGQNIPGLFVIRIVVHQGDVNEFYTYMNYRKEIVGYERMDARKESFQYPRFIEQIKLYCRNPKLRAHRIQFSKPDGITDSPHETQQPSVEKRKQGNNDKGQKDQNKNGAKSNVKSNAINEQNVKKLTESQQPTRKEKQEKSQKMARTEQQQQSERSLKSEKTEKNKEGHNKKKHEPIGEQVRNKLQQADALIDFLESQEAYHFNESRQLKNLRKFFLSNLDNVNKQVKHQMKNMISRIDEIFHDETLLDTVSMIKNQITQSAFQLLNEGDLDNELIIQSFEQEHNPKVKKSKNKYKKPKPETTQPQAKSEGSERDWSDMD